MRLDVATHVNKLLAERAPRQPAATKLLGIAPAHVSELKNCKLDRFSLEHLLRFLTLLGCNVEIVIRPKAGSHGRLTVIIA